MNGEREKKVGEWKEGWVKRKKNGGVVQGLLMDSLVRLPQEGFLASDVGGRWNSRSTGVSEDIFAWTGWLGENLRELLCCYEFLWLWMRQGHRNGISQLSILNLHRFKSSVVSAGGSFLQRFLFPFLIWFDLKWLNIIVKLLNNNSFHQFFFHPLQWYKYNTTLIEQET